MKTIYAFILFMLFASNISAQEYIQYSAHKMQNEYFDSLAKFAPEDYKALTESKIKLQKNKDNSTLQKHVFGWHPYWENGSEQNYQWNLLSELSYFSYEVDPVTGYPLDIHNWKTANVIDLAQANGVRVNLCVTLFNEHESFFASAASQQNLIDNLLTLVQNRNANGINIDFEGVPASEKDNFTNFLVNISDQFHTNIPGSQVSIALYAVDWSGVFDITVIKDYLDLFIIMGYGYYWKGSSYAGPTGQLFTFYNFNYNISKSINTYLNAGIPKEKLLCGVPYYGYEWKTSGENVPSSTTANGTSRTIKKIKDNSAGYYNTPLLNENSMSNYYTYYSGGNWHQAWVDDETTMKYKYDLIQQRDIGGIGIWALGYDDGYTEMWDLIRDRFSDNSVTPCQYTIWDMGGPKRNYYNNEDYTFTIAPDNVSLLSLDFSEFSLESGYDSLWVYDGIDTNAELIGGYSGTTSPGFVEASNNALTLKFHSDGATVRSGWKADWNCSPVNVENISENNMKVYPNPANTFCTVSGIIPDKAQIIDINGKLLKQYNYENTLKVSYLPNGIYFLKIISGNKIYIKKLIIQH